MPRRIVMDPNVCAGRPIVAGTRMRVSDILDALASGDSIDELLADLPYITREDIDACLTFGAHAVDHSGANRLMRLVVDTAGAGKRRRKWGS